MLPLQTHCTVEIWIMNVHLALVEDRIAQRKSHSRRLTTILFLHVCTSTVCTESVPKSSYWSPRITFTLWWSSQWFLEDALKSDNCISATISVQTIKCFQQQASTYINTVVSGMRTALFQVYWGKHWLPCYKGGFGSSMDMH